MQANSLNYSLDSLRDRSSLSQIQADMTELDTALTHAVNLLESAREKGFVYQKDLDEIAYQAMDRWQGIRQQLQNTTCPTGSLLSEPAGSPGTAGHRSEHGAG